MHKTKGTTLIETVLALAVLAVVTIAVVSLLTQIASVTNSAKQRSKAVSFMEQNLEKVRGYYQEKGWVGLATINSGPPACPNGCYADGSLVQCQSLIPGSPTCITDTSSCTNGYNVADNIYQDVVITPSADKVQVESFVAWMDKDKCQRVNTKTYYYNY